MATAKPTASTAPAAHGRRPRRILRRLLLVLALVAAGTLAWFWGPLRSYVVTGASYGARIACSCRHVEGRPLGDCRKDFEPGMAMVRLSEDEDARSVTASYPLLASQTAVFREGQGCVPETWGG